MGGSSGESSSTEPWKDQRQYLRYGFQEAADTYKGNKAQYYPGQTYADFDPLQETGLQNMAGYSEGIMPQLVGDTQGAYRGMLAAPDIESNPYVQDWTQAANRRLGEDFQEQVMPGIRQEAIAAGGLGGSRQGVAEGIAAGKVAQAMGDQTANMYAQAYGQGLDQQARGMAVAPQALGLGLLPGQTQADIGGIYQGQDQRGITEAIDRYNYNQMAPWDDLNRYASLVAGQPWGEETRTSGGSSKAAGALGGALSGAATGAALGTAVPGIGNVVGAIGGGLIGGLGGYYGS